MQKTSVASSSGGAKFSGYEMIADDPQPYVEWENRLGGEVVQNDQITHIQQAVVTCLFRTDLNLDMVIVIDDRMYTILSWAERGKIRRKYTAITVEFLKEYVLT